MTFLSLHLGINIKYMYVYLFLFKNIEIKYIIEIENRRNFGEAAKEIRIGGESESDEARMDESESGNR